MKNSILLLLTITSLINAGSILSKHDSSQRLNDAEKKYIEAKNALAKTIEQIENQHNRNLYRKKRVVRKPKK